jgi:hypothetical protein
MAKVIQNVSKQASWKGAPMTVKMKWRSLRRPASIPSKEVFTGEHRCMLGKSNPP